MYLRFHKGIVLDVGFKQKRKIPENGLFKPFSRTCVWQGQKDLNPRHAVLETAALPTELYPYINSQRYYYTQFEIKVKMNFDIKHNKAKIKPALN